MKRADALIMVGSTSIALLIALLLIRWLAPGLLGVAPDLQMVQVAKKVPPYFSNVFNEDPSVHAGPLIADPETIQRGNPLFRERGTIGPHDLLGFRNRNVPRYADIVTLGDSQTYGNNALMELTWPSQLEDLLAGEGPCRIYNLSLGGWGPLQYLEILRAAEYFAPQAIVVAFYFGNDPLDAFRLTYGNERWKQYRLTDQALSANTIPSVKFPAPPAQQWQATFADGYSTTFTPQLRLASNMRHPATDAGHEIILQVARQIALSVRDWPEPPAVFFTVIPTKELVFAPRARADGLKAPAAYTELVTAETTRIREFAERLRPSDGQYIDLVKPLQLQAMSRSDLYRSDANGHPNHQGYRVIAKAILRQVGPVIRKVPAGLVRVFDTQAALMPKDSLVFTAGRRYWSVRLQHQNGQAGADSTDEGIPQAPAKLLHSLDFVGTLTVDRNVLEAMKQGLVHY